MLFIQRLPIAEFHAEPPRELFTVPTIDDNTIPVYDVTSDGQRFLVLLHQESDQAPTQSTQLIVVLNWFEELKRLVPTN